MYLLNRITIKNFKSFREKTIFNLADGSYFIGANNSGKSTVLSAARFFFNDEIFTDESFINKTAFLSKKLGSNIVEITVDFNTEALRTKKLKQDLNKKYGTVISVTKIFSISTETKLVTRTYKINGQNVLMSLPEEVIKLMNSVKVTYLHPQEGQELLVNAQEKLRKRLLENWGRGFNITQSIKKLQEAWDDLRVKANTYLSGSLTDNLQEIWPESEVTINMPKDIREIIAVSDINFLGYKSAPEINLISQGTGAQSTVLYLTHFLLDIDRSMHRGEYHPLWLLEEPESFLHVDLLASLAKQLNSEKWLGNIQMMISTHSPVLLAGSRVANDRVVWNALAKGGLIYNKNTPDFSDEEIKEIGKLMGDPNFFAYFLAAQNEVVIFCEDSKKLTIERYRESGIQITRGLNGVSEISKYLDVYTLSPFTVNAKMFFIIDADKGKDELSRFYDNKKVVEEKGGFKKFSVNGVKNIFIILLPDGNSSEDLYEEFDNHLEECVSKLWDTENWQHVSSVPTEIIRTFYKIRSQSISSKEEAKKLIKNTDDVKDLFWEKVKKFDYQINQKYSQYLQKILS